QLAAAVNFIRSCKGLYQNNRAITAPKLGRRGLCQRLEFLYGRERCALSILILRRVIVVYAVDLKSCAARSRAIEINRGARRQRRVVLSRIRIFLKAGERFRER